jgi:hypothetical protein
MSSFYRNAEGYFDPVAGEAFSRIAREERKAGRQHIYRPLVYVCSRYAGDVVRNILAAQKFCRFAVNQNMIPVASHLLYPQFLDDRNPAERELGLFFGKILMDKCDEVWIFSDGEYSAGMQAEYDRAVKKGYKIRCFTTDCREIASHGNGGGDGPI